MAWALTIVGMVVTNMTSLPLSQHDEQTIDQAWALIGRGVACLLRLLDIDRIGLAQDGQQKDGRSDY